MYDGSIGLSSLKVVPISQASAIQRAGRAGRTSEGLCYRLYPFSVYDQLSTVAIPEISRTELSSVILQLKALGIDNFMKLQWLTVPPSESIAQSFSSLLIQSVIDNDGRLSSLGNKVAEIPLDVKAACMVRSFDKYHRRVTYSALQLLNSEKFRCGEEILTIIAMAAVQVLNFDPLQLTTGQKNMFSRMSLLFPQVRQELQLSSNAESLLRKKGYSCHLFLWEDNADLYRTI
jgi:ATP-dependent RNA helicase DDX35